MVPWSQPFRPEGDRGLRASGLCLCHGVYRAGETGFPGHDRSKAGDRNTSMFPVMTSLWLCAAAGRQTFYFSSVEFPRALYILGQTLGTERKGCCCPPAALDGLGMEKNRGGTVTVLFYDPNDTCRYRIVTARSPEDLGKVQLDDLIPLHNG